VYKLIYLLTYLLTITTIITTSTAPHCSKNEHSTLWQEFLGCGSENLEQSSRLTAAAWHGIWTLKM